MVYWEKVKRLALTSTSKTTLLIKKVYGKVQRHKEKRYKVPLKRIA